MNDPSIRLCLVIHNHQPIGNFDDVFQQSYVDSYLPFLNEFEPFENLKLTLHLSGPLAIWLNEHHPDYLDRIADLVEQRRLEIIGGPMYEPILTMLPTRDRIGQINAYTTWLSERLQAQVQGMWVPERVWEASLAKDLVKAGMKYTLLDDFHFVNAGLDPQQLHGVYITEDEGHILRVFPGSERLRYAIPFAAPQETIEHLRQLSHRFPGTVVTFGDDGEKFGTWPDTQKHVYEDGWLRNFFQALEQQRDWLRTDTLEEAVLNTPPTGKIYLPDCSYREMTEWSYPVARQIQFHQLEDAHGQLEQWPQIRSFISGGFWRNFRVKYREAAELYARMMFVSSLLDQTIREGRNSNSLDQARDLLYQAQCNCAYWHGAFGGIYLPHLRNAVYERLIQAEQLIDQAYNRPDQWVEGIADDFDFDGRPEIRLANDQLIAWIAPEQGGIVYELDVKSVCQNLLASLQRREEAYHEQVARGPQKNDDQTASIHNRVIFKQTDLDQHLVYDATPRKSLVDHFWDPQVGLPQVMDGTAVDLGQLVNSSYQAQIRRKQDRVQVLLNCQAHIDGRELKITKGITLNSGSNELEIAYLIEQIPEDHQFHFGVEFNFAAMPANHDDRCFRDAHGNSLGQLGTQLDLQAVSEISLCDNWLGLLAQLRWNQLAGLWTFPIQTVSQSEGGFELIHQSVVVQPHWLIQGDASGRWATELKLKLQDGSVGKEGTLTGATQSLSHAHPS